MEDKKQAKRVEKLPTGGYRITGGFSTKNPEDVSLIKNLIFHTDSSTIAEFIRNSKLEYEKTSQSYKDYKKRFIYDKISGRLVVLYGMRGTGKTTLMFQKYLETDEKTRIYLNGNEMAVLKVPILEAVREVEKLIGKNAVVFLDEINSIPGWDEEIKIAYDKYPEMKFFLTGSSSINLLESKKILARRAIYLPVPVLGLREFVYLKHSIMLDQFKPNKEDLLRSIMRYDIYIHEKLKGTDILQLSREYIQTNLPYLLDNDRSTLADLVEKAIFSDIAKARNIETATLSKFERLILILSASTKISYDTIATDLGVSKSIVTEMLSLLERAELIKRVYPYKKGKSLARKQWKYYFTVPAIRELYAKKMVILESDLKGNMMEDIFAVNFENIFYDDIDFVYGEYLVEVGSKSKDFRQFSKVETDLLRLIVYEGADISESQGVIKIPFYVWYSQI